MHRKMGGSNREIAACLGENCEVVRVWLADIRKGHLRHPLAEEPWPARKNAAQGAPEDHGAVHRGPQAAGCDANYRTYKPLCRYAKRRWNTASRTRALRAFKEVALRSKILRPEHPLAASPGSASPPGEDEEGDGGERQGGQGGVIHATEDGTARTSAAHRTGRLKGSRDVGPLFQTAWTRGTVPSLRGEAGPKTFGARKRVFRNDGEGRPSMHAGRIRPVCYTNTSPRGRDDNMQGDCKAVQGPEDLRRRVHRAVPDPLQRSKNARGDRRPAARGGDGSVL